MKTVFEKLLFVSILCSLTSTLIPSPEAWGKLFGKVAGTTGLGVGGTFYMAHKYPQTLDRTIAFKRAMLGQYDPVVSSAGASSAQSSQALTQATQTAMQTKLLEGINQTNKAHASALRYQQQKDIAFGVVLVGSLVLIYDWWTGGRMRRAIGKAKDETIEYVGNKTSELGVQIKRLGTSLQNKLDSLRQWTANRFNRVETKLEQQGQDQQQRHQQAQLERQDITNTVVAGNHTTHQLLHQMLTRIPENRPSGGNAMETVDE